MKIYLLFITLTLSSFVFSKTTIYPNYISNLDESKPFAVIGDTQPTLLIEKLIGRESNNQETKKLLKFLAQKDINLLVHLGDAVNNGSKKSAWRQFDNWMSPISKKNTPVMLALGNHDYWGSNKKALKNITKRFEQIKVSSWYSRVYQNIGLIWLNTNKSELEDSQWIDQKNWFESKLNNYESDDSIKAIIVFGHHPPFSNSTVISDTEEIKQTFLPAFFKSKKTKAMISGHAHGYEHFVKKNKHFIISAGGGGPRPKNYLANNEQRHQDVYRKGTSKQPFNYLIVTPGQDSIDISSFGFFKNDKNIFLMEKINIDL